MQNIRFLGIAKMQQTIAEEAIQESVDLLSRRNPTLEHLFAATTVIIGNNLIESGGKAEAEIMKITLDAQKNSMSLLDAEDFLISQEILNPGDWTKAYKDNAKPWSSLIYTVIHEFGHIVDGNAEGTKYQRIDIKWSPTKYGSKNESEAFAEVFTYWVLGIKLDKTLEKVIQDVVSKISYKLR